METLLATLTHAVGGSAAIALGAALVWGVLSIVLSPCHLASIPLVVGFVNGQGRITTGRACALSAAFALGILLTIGAIGLLTAALGRMLGDVGAWGNYAVAVVFFAVGLHMLGVWTIGGGGPRGLGVRSKGLAAAFALGLIFGVALGPCTFAFMAPVLTLTLKLGATRPLYGAALIGCYGLGHCSVIVLAGTSAELVQRYLDWDERSRGTRWVRGACGALLLVAGLYLIYIAR